MTTLLHRRLLCSAPFFGLLALGLWLSPRTTLTAVEVTSVGRAPLLGSHSEAKAEALKDALRNAVQRGAGVDILSSTSVKNFILEFDRVVAASFGYVTDYREIASRIDAYGMIEVTIRANVEKGLPEMHEKLSLRAIVEQIGSPWVLIEEDEYLEGVPSGASIARGLTESVAKTIQLQVFDREMIARKNDECVRQAESVRDFETAKRLRAAPPLQADWIIKVKVRGSYLGEIQARGLRPRHGVAVAVTLSAVQADTGELLATKQFTSEGFDMLDKLIAYQIALNSLLKDDAPQHKAPIWQFIAELIEAALVRQDRGSSKRLEFVGLDPAQCAALESHLKSAPKVGRVRVEFASGGLTVIYMHTWLGSVRLDTEAVNALKGRFECVKRTEDTFHFVRRKNWLHQRLANVPPWIGITVGTGTLALVFIYRSIKNSTRKRNWDLDD